MTDAFTETPAVEPEAVPEAPVEETPVEAPVEETPAVIPPADAPTDVTEFPSPGLVNQPVEEPPYVPEPDSYEGVIQAGPDSVNHLNSNPVAVVIPDEVAAPDAPAQAFQVSVADAAVEYASTTVEPGSVTPENGNPPDAPFTAAV